MNELMNLMSYLPMVDLFAHGVSLDVAGFLYDVSQAVAGLHLIAKGVVVVSEATPWERDDPWARKFLGMTTSAVEWVARLSGALQKK